MLKDNTVTNEPDSPMEKESFSYATDLVYTNITSTFTGIGYAILDINSLVGTALELYGLDKKQLPAQTIKEHFRYIIDNLQDSSLHDIRCYYEATGDPWTDLMMDMLNDGSFLDVARLGRAVEEDRIALVLSSYARASLNTYCHSMGLYVGMLDSLVFEIPFANCHVLRPADILGQAADYPSAEMRIESENYAETVEEFLARKGFTVATMNEEFGRNDEEYVFDPLSETIGEEIAKAMYQRNRKEKGEKLYFDGRIYHGTRRPGCSDTEPCALAPASDIAWSGKDLDLLMPPIPDRPNPKHLANIRRSAMSMYERSFHYSTVVEAPSVARKVSVKMQKIMDENMARIKADKMKADNAWLRGFYTNYSRMSSLAGKKAYVENIKLDNEYINNKLLLLKIELYMDVWRLEQRSTAVNEKVLVPLYLACLAYVEKTVGRGTAENMDPADLVELEFAMTKLVEAGFEATAHELAEKHGLPEMSLPFKTKATAAPSDIDLYFQLKYAGEHLKRTLGTRKDRRVPFDPDQWQVDLLDTVDADRSAIVAAPTSSGKTFICYYAAEKVLKSSDTDVVVFCLPTKALVNQVSADIYARFSPKNCRTSLQGTLMADRCMEPFTSQILITIPSMLESWLATRGSTGIRYIIIDEVHKINDPGLGLAIERIIHMARCPLLLLSATIGNLDGFYGWFKGIENAKGRECVLVTHGERFCELKPFVYRGDLSVEELRVALTDKPADTASDRLVPLNCMFAYSFQHLRDFGFGNDIHFLPEELLNMYYYIYMALDDSQKKMIKSLAPKKFFKSNIICKADIKQYEHHLLSTFERWVREGVLAEAQVREVYRMLVGDSLGAFPRVQTEEYLVSNMLALLDSLKEKDMLPVIVFNTDRELLTRLAKAVFSELERRDMRKKKDKLAEKQRKETKRNRDNEKTRISWIEESITSEQNVEPDTRDIRYTFLDPLTKLTDCEVREELADSRGTPKSILDMAYRGIGVHHAAMERKYRSAIEILFRKKHVRVLFATETLALGINMPCRTVVFAGDSLQLDPMNYRQMAGRAGRRGYDTLGNVVFLGIPRGRVQNLMVSMLPDIQGSYTYSNTSLVSFQTEESLVRQPLLGSDRAAWRNSAYTFEPLGAENTRRELVEFQKRVCPEIFPSSYLWDLFISNRGSDPAIFLFGMLFQAGKISWDQDSLILTIAHLFEVRPCSPNDEMQLEPLPAETADFIKQVNSNYRQSLRRFYSPQLRTLSALASRPLHYVRSFVFLADTPKNSYIYDFFHHGSARRIFVRNRIPVGELWQSLYNIDALLCSLKRLVETYFGSEDERLRKLRVTYKILHDKFKEIFA